MGRKVCVSFVLCFYFLVSQGQITKPYSHFLKRDSTVKRSLIFGSGGYTYAFPSGVSSNIGTGQVLCVGVNLARLVTKKFHFGVFGGIKVKALLSEGGDYTESFQKGLSENYDPSSYSGSDTILPAFFLKQVQSKGLGGSTLLQYGISLNYPVRFIPLIKFYRMKVSEAIEGSDYNSMMGEEEQDWISLTYKGSGVSLSFDLSDINKKISLDGAKIILAFYCERYDLTDSKIQDVRLDSFIKQPFFDRYSYFYRGGISLSIGFY